jgi:hypothetical protein
VGCGSGSRFLDFRLGLGFCLAFPRGVDLSASPGDDKSEGEAFG